MCFAYPTPTPRKWDFVEKYFHNPYDDIVFMNFYLSIKNVMHHIRYVCQIYYSLIDCYNIYNEYSTLKIKSILCLVPVHRNSRI